MMIPPYASGNLLMPRWAYVPGETDEANADYETLAQAKLLVPPRFRGYVPARHPALRYGLTLNDRGYFWESQEVLEAVWAAAPQGGRERILLRGCILIATANLRLRMQKPHAAARLLGDAMQELYALSARQATAAGDGFADGFPTAALVELLKSRLDKPLLSKAELSKADWVEIGAIIRT
jgi:DUF309 family protein family protein